MTRRSLCGLDRRACLEQSQDHAHDNVKCRPAATSQRQVLSPSWRLRIYVTFLTNTMKQPMTTVKTAVQTVTAAALRMTFEEKPP